MSTYIMPKADVVSLIGKINLNRDVHKMEKAIFTDTYNTPVITWTSPNELKISAFDQEIITTVNPGEELEMLIEVLLKELWKQVESSSKESTWMKKNGFILDR